MTQDELSDLRRNYDSAVSKVGKSGYLAGNGGEKLVATTYMKWAQANNTTSNPHAIIPKKKYRKN